MGKTLKLGLRLKLAAFLGELLGFFFRPLPQHLSSSTMPCSAAYLWTSSVIFIEQKCGPRAGASLEAEVLSLESFTLSRKFLLLSPRIRELSVP